MFGRSRARAPVGALEGRELSLFFTAPPPPAPPPSRAHKLFLPSQKQVQSRRSVSAFFRSVLKSGLSFRFVWRKRQPSRKTPRQHVLWLRARVSRRLVKSVSPQKQAAAQIEGCIGPPDYYSKPPWFDLFARRPALTADHTDPSNRETMAPLCAQRARIGAASPRAFGR